VELRQLRYFCAVAEELSFARASRRLFIAQPALSIQIRNLEHELKAQLLRRTTRSVELTHAGRTFYDEAREILGRVETASQHAFDAEQGVIGTLRVALLPNVATAELGGRLGLFRARFPRINLSLSAAPSHRQIQMLLRRDIDVGLLRFSRETQRRRGKPGTAGADLTVDQMAIGSGFSPEELASEEVARQRMIIAVSAAGPLAGTGPVAWRDLHQQPMVGTSDVRERYFEPFFTCCERARVRPVITQQASDLMTRLWLVACGFGFSPTTASSQEISRPGLCYRALPRNGPEVLTFAAWRRRDSAPHVLQFIEILKRPLAPG
jgi:DNA-binding transcriptional LysR family regulator